MSSQERQKRLSDGSSSSSISNQAQAPVQDRRKASRHARSSHHGRGGGASASQNCASDEDLDPDLREGIHNIMKLRDEYDKLEGALRKLGVDPDTIVGNHNTTTTSEEDSSEVLDPDLCTPFNVVAVPANPANLEEDGESLATMSRTVNARLRHLDILEEVDESVLSSENGEDTPLPPPPPPDDEESLDSRRHYPWLQMALPGGGIVSVPLERASSGAGSSAKARSAEDPDLSPTRGHLVPPLQPTSASCLPPSSTSAAASGPGSVGSGSNQADLLTVAAGEPVTHFNLDQLLEIVQSFQLDTTMAGHEETLKTARDLALCADLASAASAAAAANAASSASTSGLASKNIPGISASGCDAKLHCDSAPTLQPQQLPSVSSSSLSSSLFRGKKPRNGGNGLSSIGETSSGRMGGSSGPFRSSNSVIGCESYLHHSSNNFEDIREEAEAIDEPQGHRLETHSCPSSPTETDCSSGFSTLRRRSVTVTEKIRTNKDGSKTQVVRQYGCNTSSANEPEQSVTYEKNSYVYINSDAASNPPPEGEILSLKDEVSLHADHENDPFADYSGRGGMGGNGAPGGVGGPGSHANVSASNQYRSHIVRLNSIEPNTVMFSTKDYPILSDISVPEIIDELEKQFEDKLCDLQGVRLVGSNVYICLSRKDSLTYLSTYGFYVRGVPVKVVDITHDSVVICLTGVPHYITDSTVTMLVSTFGIAIGEVERRFYKGVDTGERYVRLKPRAHTQVPDFVTVGGCKILIRVLSNEEVCPPYTLQSQVKEKHPTSSSSFLDHQAFNSQTTATFANSSIVTSSSASANPIMAAAQAASSGFTSIFRAKPGHCNGTLNSPESPAALPSLKTLSPVPRATDLLLTGITGDHTETSSSRDLASPKIAKSFRSRLTMGLGSSPPTQTSSTSKAMHREGHDEVDNGHASRTYVPGDPINDIPSLSPPPYKGPGSTGGSSTTSNSGGRSGGGITGLGLLSRITNRNSGNHNTDGSGEDYKTNTLGRGSKFNRHNNMAKTDSSNSLGSHKNGDLGGGGGGKCNGNGSSSKNRSSVVFEEPLKTTTTNSHSSGTSTVPPPSASRVATATNRTVNGILRKGSVPGDDIVGPPPEKENKSKSRKMSKMEKAEAKASKKKLESVTESGLEDGDSTTTTKDGKDRSSRSRSSSTKTSSSKADKAAKDLALTRDLPWCGCWGNGCL